MLTNQLIEPGRKRVLLSSERSVSSTVKKKKTKKKTLITVMVIRESGAVVANDVAKPLEASHPNLRFSDTSEKCRALPKFSVVFLFATKRCAPL